MSTDTPTAKELAAAQGLLDLGNLATKPAAKLTQKDRDALLSSLKSVRMWPRPQQSGAQPTMLAQFEVEMQTHYTRQDNEVFARVTEVLAIAVQKAREEINKECEPETKIVAASFDPGAAMEALNAMPKVETLIPPMSFATIDQIFKRDPQKMIDEFNRTSSYRHIRADDVYSLASPAEGSNNPWATNDDDED
jgi:hypothetical protein